MSLLQAMTASKSELMQKLAGVYRQHGLTDAQAATDLLAVVELFPEVADEIPGFEKVAGIPGLGWLAGGTAKATTLGSKALATARPVLQAAKTELGNVGGALREAGGSLMPKRPVPLGPPAPFGPPRPPVPAAPAAAVTPATAPELVNSAADIARLRQRITAPQASVLNTPRPAQRQPVRPWQRPAASAPAAAPAPTAPNPAGVLPTLQAAGQAAPAAFGSAARATFGSPAVDAAKAGLGAAGRNIGAVPGMAVDAAKAAPGFVRDHWSNIGARSLAGGATGGGVAMLTGGDPLAGFVGGALTSAGGATVSPATGWRAGLGGAAGTGGTAGMFATPVAGLAQQGIRNYVDPALGTNLGQPIRATGQDPTRAASADELGLAIGQGGNDLTRLMSTTKTPTGQAQVGMQQRGFADQALAKAQAEFPDKVPDAQAAIERAMPGMTDSVLGDPETIQAFKSPELTQQYVAKTDTLEQQLMAEVGSGAPDPAKHGPALAAIAKRRMAIAAKSAGATPAAMAAKAQQIEQNLNDGNLSAEDLQTVLSTPAGKQFLDTYTANSTAQNLAGGAGMTPPSLGGATVPQGVPAPTGAPTADPTGAPAPTGGAAAPNPTGDPTASGGMDMGAIFSKIGEFAAANPAQFAALALGIPIALSGLAMSMAGGPSLGSILALVLGGGMAAGGMGQFGGIDLMSPLQQFFGGGAAAAPDAPPPAAAAAPPAAPSAAPDPRLGSPEFNLAAPQGGAAASPAAPFPVPDIGDAVNQPLGV